jgi:hypothetical protein
MNLPPIERRELFLIFERAEGRIAQKMRMPNENHDARNSALNDRSCSASRRSISRSVVPWELTRLTADRLDAASKSWDAMDTAVTCACGGTIVSISKRL